MSGRIITILILLCSFSLQAQEVFDPMGKVYGEGFGKTLEEADKNALRELGSSLQTKVSSNVLTQTKNGETIVLSNTFTTVSLDVKTSQRFVAERKKRKVFDPMVFGETLEDEYHVYRFIEIEPYVSYRMKNYENLYSLSTEHNDDVEVKCGYLYLAYCELNDPTMDAYNVGNAALKKDIENTVRDERNNLGGKINFYICGPNDNLIALDVPYEWKNGIPKPAPKPVKTETKKKPTTSHTANQTTIVVVNRNENRTQRSEKSTSQYRVDGNVRIVYESEIDTRGCHLIQETDFRRR